MSDKGRYMRYVIALIDKTGINKGSSYVLLEPIGCDGIAYVVDDNDNRNTLKDSEYQLI